MIKNLTELVFILDRNNGSMQGLAIDTIGGFTAMLGAIEEDFRKRKCTR